MKSRKRDLNQLLDRAIQIAVEAHAGQQDRNGAPYVLHPLRMMMRAESLTEKIVAVLHDVVEDSDWTLKKLAKEGFPAEIVEAVDHLTKRDGEDYNAFIKRTIAHPISRRVKKLDLEDNMNVLRLDKVDRKAMARLAKYFKAWHEVEGDRVTGLH